MLFTTRAIVLRTTRYGDRKAVLKLYTEHHGVRGYSVRMGGRTGLAPALLEPLQRLAIVAHERGDRDLHHLKEVRHEKPFLRLSGDQVRGSVVHFLQEVLLRALHEEAGDPLLFGYLHAALDLVDEAPDLGHFPIAFLTGFSRHLGFAPEPLDVPATWFDMRDGVFALHEPPHPHAFHGPAVPLFERLLELPLEDGLSVSASVSLRRELLGRLLHYYRLHVDGFGELRSPAVLHGVLA